MKICVTGGAGFIGSHLVDALVVQGHDVTVIDNLSTGCKSFVSSQVEFYEMDIRDAAIEELFVSKKFDYVFHEAAQTMVNVSMDNPKEDCDINLMGLINILEACRKTGVKKIIMPSSAAVYGDLTTLPLQEDMNGVPSSFYGLTKLTTESYLKLYQENFNLPFICLRYSNVYGPRQGNGGEGGVVSIFCKQLQKGKNLTIFGDGEQTRDFIYVHDVVDANLACLDKTDAQGIYNVSTNTAVSVNQLAEELIKASKKNVKINYEEPRQGDIKHSRLDTSKSIKDLEWEAKVSIEEGLDRTFAYFKNN